MMRLGRVKPIISSQRFTQVKSADEIKIEKQIRYKIKKSLLAQQDRIFKDSLWFFDFITTYTIFNSN